jgi:hypothetical protein
MDGDAQGQSCTQSNLPLLGHDSLNGDVHVPSRSESNRPGNDLLAGLCGTFGDDRDGLSIPPFVVTNRLSEKTPYALDGSVNCGNRACAKAHAEL